MRLPKLAIENHQFTNVFILLLVLAGLFSFLSMPRYEDPLVSPAGSSVIVIYPGANPVDIEELIIGPLEEALNELEDIEVLDSSCEDGIGVIRIEFQFGSNSNKKYADVVQKVNSVRPQLPQNIHSIETMQWTISDVHIYQFALLSETESYRTLEKEAERLKKSLEKIPSIKRARVWAFPEQEVRISVRLEKLAMHSLSLNQVLSAIQAYSFNMPGGQVDIGTKNLTFKPVDHSNL